MTVTSLLFVGLMILAAVAVLDVARQYCEALGLLRYLSRESRFPATAEEMLPPAAVILALRGPDPHLTHTLNALLAQDYPNFIIQVVVDSAEDPVISDVERARTLSDRIRMAVLKSPGNQCSLKCSSLIQAVQSLSDDVKLVAFIDGDVVPHPRWLRDLASPIVTGRADVTGGNRWYLPSDCRMGSLVRYFWNAGFMREMWTQGAPWAGTMAMTRETIHRIGLLDAWQSSMSVDATLHRCLNQQHQRFQLVPSLVMCNRESISLSQFHTWVTRQMAVVRYTASHTVRSVQIHVLTLLLLHLLLGSMTLISALVGDIYHASAAALILFSYWLLLALGAGVQEAFLRRTVRKQGEPTGWLTLSHLLLWYPGMILTHWVLVFGVLKSLRMTDVNWRGINYRLLSNGGVLMEGYRPFTSSRNSSDGQSVI
jgi:glycosyltransferase involved in cell wall biosynthesis